MDMYSEFEAHNGEALQSLVQEHGVELRAFPDDVLAELKRVSFEMLEEQAAADEMSGKVWASMKAYLEKVRSSTAVGSQYFVDHR
jgi:TRAP-type mannitol/chloroaromatic compound transport system substrate-binding protein